MKHVPPILAAILLLLPVLYVGSYCALVTPEGTPILIPLNSSGSFQEHFVSYRYGSDLAAILFWPLENMDRKLRPAAWDSLPSQDPLLP